MIPSSWKRGFRYRERGQSVCRKTKFKRCGRTNRRSIIRSLDWRLVSAWVLRSGREPIIQAPTIRTSAKCWVVDLGAESDSLPAREYRGDRRRNGSTLLLKERLTPFATTLKSYEEIFLSSSSLSIPGLCAIKSCATTMAHRHRTREV